MTLARSQSTTAINGVNKLVPENQEAQYRKHKHRRANWHIGRAKRATQATYANHGLGDEGEITIESLASAKPTLELDLSVFSTHY